MYDLGDRLLMVASDRISAYDVVLPTAIPDKGKVLTGLSVFWFDRTADIVSNHPHDLGTLDANQLREIPGIGKDLAARIRDIAETGDTPFHRELLAEFPPTILDLLHLQGVGPKTVAVLYKELGVGIYETGLEWDHVAPTRPRDAGNPNDPAYQWPAAVDQAVAQARRYGMRVSITLTR